MAWPGGCGPAPGAGSWPVEAAWSCPESAGAGCAVAVSALPVGSQSRRAVVGAPGTTYTRNDEGPSMHELEGPRRSCCPAVIDCSTSAGLAGLLRVVPAPIARDRHGVERVAPRGPPVPIARVQLLRGAGASRGPLVPIARVQLLREAASRGPPVPIARVQLLREARSPRPSGPDRSSPAPSRSVAPPTLPRSLEIRLHETAPPRRALIAQDTSSWDGCPRCDLAIARPSTPRNPPPLRENPLLTVVSHCLPASRKFPSESVPVPGDKEMSTGPAATPTRTLSQGFRRLFRSTGRSTAGHRLSPENPALSTASSTV